MQCIKVKDLKRQLSGTTIAVSSTHVLQELLEVETLYPPGLHCLCFYDFLRCHVMPASAVQASTWVFSKDFSADLGLKRRRDSVCG